MANHRPVRSHSRPHGAHGSRSRIAPSSRTHMGQRRKRPKQSAVHMRGRKTPSKMMWPELFRRRRLAGVGAIALGTGGVIAANVFGVGELALGAFVAYVTYRIIRYGVPPTEAILEGVELEHGEVPKKEAA